jgi:hypothetical protein
LSIIPTTLFSALTSGVVLQTLFVALLVGFALQVLGHSGEAILRGVKHLERLVFRVMSHDHVVGADRRVRAIAAVVGATGWKALIALGQVMCGFLHHVSAVRDRASGPAVASHHRSQHFSAAELSEAGVPPDRFDILLGGRAAPADREDGAPGRLPVSGWYHRCLPGTHSTSTAQLST